jgi:hypothetical protein
MSKSVPTKTQKWVRELSWFGGAEGAAFMAVLLAVPFTITRLAELIHNRA